MKKIVFISLIVSALFSFYTSVNAQNDNASLLRHIVIITFKRGASVDSIKALDDVYKDLSKDASVKYFEMGVNISNRDSTLKHVYVTSFASKEDMDKYRKIPEYSKLFKLSLPISDDVTVADYWANK